MRLPTWAIRMVDRSALIANVLIKYPPEYKLGEGAYKYVYASGNIAVGLSKWFGQIRKEVGYLKRLHNIGLPVVEVVDHISCGSGMRGGAIIMRRYRETYRITKKVYKQCEEIAKKLKTHKIDVLDLHVLLDDKNNVILADPLQICKYIRSGQEFKFSDCMSIWI